jgi:DNA polymerase-3 subunit gamma/tau
VPPVPSRPAPTTFAEVVALFKGRKEARLANHLAADTHPVRCEPGRLEFRPTPSAPRDLAPRVAEFLTQWTGRRWMVSLSSDAGGPTLAQQQAMDEDARRAEAMQHPLVLAAMAAFPGAILEAVRSKTDAALFVPMAPSAGEDSSDAGAEGAGAEEYPTDDFEEIPEHDY